jgi:hypothetical protein
MRVRSATPVLRLPGVPSIDRAALKVALFGFVLASQLGHLGEHILLKLTGLPFLGSVADTEETHLIFNGLVAVFAVGLVRAFPHNPWVYPLVLLSVFHGIEHVYIYEQYLRIGTSDGPGLLGIGGAIGLIPVARLELHNIYNGFELILIVLGFRYETGLPTTSPEGVADASNL